MDRLVLTHALTLAQATENERNVVIDALAKANLLVEPLEPGDVISDDCSLGPLLVLKNTVLDGKHVLVLFSFYEKKLYVTGSWLLRSTCKKITHIDPKSIFKEDIKYGV